MGHRFPFGAQVSYKPSEKVSKRLPRWDGSTILGIFVGYEMKTGCRWNGAYLLIPKSILQTWKQGKRTHCDSVREVVWSNETEIIFLPENPPDLHNHPLLRESKQAKS